MLFNYKKLRNDIPYVVRAMDNVVDRAIYPLPQQEFEAKSKRRMGLGVTGLAHTSEVLGFPYGSTEMLAFTKEVLTLIRDCCYLSSCELAVEKGVFPYYDKTKYLQGLFIRSLPDEIRATIERTGIRNSHLLSIAPTGTISLSAGNISSGVEPPYTTGTYRRKVYRPDGRIEEFQLTDWVEENHSGSGIKPVSASECDIGKHVSVLNLASSLVDSSVSKTCNVGKDVSFEDFRNVYLAAYRGGASGCTTFRDAGFREGIFSKGDRKEKDELNTEGSACYIDSETGMRTCE